MNYESLNRNAISFVLNTQALSQVWILIVRNWPIKARIRCHGISRKPIRRRAVGEKIQFPTPESLRGMGTRFQGNDSWDRFGRTSVNYDWSMVLKATINQSQVTLVNSSDPPEIVALKACTHSSNSFWIEEFHPYLLLLLVFSFQVVNCLCQLGSTVSISGVFGRCTSTGSEAVLTL